MSVFAYNKNLGQQDHEASRRFEAIALSSSLFKKFYRSFQTNVKLVGSVLIQIHQDHKMFPE